MRAGARLGGCARILAGGEKRHALPRPACASMLLGAELLWCYGVRVRCKQALCKFWGVKPGQYAM